MAIAAARPLRFLVCDAYPRERREDLVRVGGSLGGDLYRRLLLRLEPEAQVDVIHPADEGDALPPGRGLESYDGVTWTGSSLTIHHDADPRVRRQVELARAVYAAGVPSFGSCWAAQLAVVAAGGRCAASPKGREFGISRRIALTDEGRSHPMYAGKAPVFDAFTSHADEVTVMPDHSAVLASNDYSRVQAVSIEARGSFWAVQYHPEYDLHEVAALCLIRMDDLIRQGTFADRAEGDRYVEDLEALHADPSRDDLAELLGVTPALLDESQRAIEARNWIERKVKKGLGAGG